MTIRVYEESWDMKPTGKVPVTFDMIWRWQRYRGRILFTTASYWDDPNIPDWYLAYWL